ncbi:MAG: sodium:calcium antiporter [Armatimonadota bacterium]
MNDYAAMVVGVVCAASGGELFIRGMVGLARWLRVSAGIIAVTITAFATSSPELSVAISSAINKKPEIAMGDALGSNVVNVGLILGLALVMGGLRNDRREVIGNYFLAMAAPLLVGILSADGVLSRLDGIMLLIVFVVWVTWITLRAREQRVSDSAEPTKSSYISLVYAAIGLALLVAAGHYIVQGASGVALKMGLNPFIVGAVIVAFGTSVPELATVLISRWKGHDDIGLNAIIGSNLFNGMMILGTAATICDIKVNPREAWTVLLFGIITVAMTLPNRAGLLARWRGVVLIALYAAYVWLIR